MEPEREIPGIIAIACVIPRITASLNFKSCLLACINFLVRRLDAILIALSTVIYFFPPITEELSSTSGRGGA